MRLLPILWAEEPTAEDWARLGQARIALGYADLIQPAQALHGSPGPILAIGAYPSWLTTFARVESTEDPIALQGALRACLEPIDVPVFAEDMASLLSGWMDADVTYAGEEEHDGGVQFV